MSEYAGGGGSGLILLPKEIHPKDVCGCGEIEYRQNMLDGLKSIDTNLFLILKALTKPKRKKNASK